MIFKIVNFLTVSPGREGISSYVLHFIITEQKTAINKMKNADRSTVYRFKFSINFESIPQYCCYIDNEMRNDHHLSET